jgi:hypothetical protein
MPILALLGSNVTDYEKLRYRPHRAAVKRNRPIPTKRWRQEISAPVGIAWRRDLMYVSGNVIEGEKP